MPGFLKVHAATGAKHEFYAPADWVAAHPDAYKVLDKTPVAQPGPVVYVSGKAPAKASKSVGETNKEGAE
jgi:hypothetical protein